VTRDRRHGTRTLWAALAAAALVAFAAGDGAALTTLEGYSEFMGELTSSGGDDPTWELGNPKIYSELRLKSTPWKNIETFLKISAESNRWDEDHFKETEFFFREAHMRYRWSNFETHLFTGQDRFWLNEPLLEIVNPGVIKHDDYGPRAQGIRADFWDVHGFSGAAFISERSDYGKADWGSLDDAEQDAHPGSAPGDTISTNTDDYRGFRVTRSFFQNNMLFGTTYARKDYSDDGQPGSSPFYGDGSKFDEVIAFDAEMALGELIPVLTQFGRVTWVAEYGRNTSGHLWDDEDPAVNGFKTEIRDFRAGPFRFAGSYGEYGADFYTAGLAQGYKNDLNDYQRYYAEAHYRVPAKAINLKGWLIHAEPMHPGLTSYSNSVGTIDEWGTETYVKFVNGFTGKGEYKVYEDDNGTWPNLLFEVTGENRLVELTTQFRIRDIDTDYEVTAYGFESNVNLGEDWKFYARVLHVDEQTESRQTAFCQLRYNGWGGAEFFVEFGNPDHSNDLANDGDFVSHGSGTTTQEVFKAFLKIYY